MILTPLLNNLVGNCSRLLFGGTAYAVLGGIRQLNFSKSLLSVARDKFCK